MLATVLHTVAKSGKTISKDKKNIL